MQPSQIIELLVGSIIGVFITYFFQFIVKVCRLIITIFNEETKMMIGTWFIATCIRLDDEKFNIVIAECKIKYGLLHQYNIDSNDAYSSKYTGHGRFETSDLILEMNPKNKKTYDFTIHRLSLVPLRKGSLLVGTFISSDYKYKTCGGVSVLSRYQLTTEKVKKMVSKYYVISPSIGAISVK